MKFIPGTNKRRKIKDSPLSRSVIFIERKKKNEDGLKRLTKRRFFSRNFFIFTKIPKTFITFALIIIAAIALVFLFFIFTDTNYTFESPLPKKNKNLIMLNEINIKIENELKRQKIDFKEIDTSNGSVFYIILADKQEVVIAGDKDIPTQIASLQFIYNQLTMEGKEFKRLDLRFDKPVITLR